MVKLLLLLLFACGSGKSQIRCERWDYFYISRDFPDGRRVYIKQKRCIRYKNYYRGYK
tara:strand:- start:2146 stop:2319 length:174 start_codon:yes stop_codon:yes gene_type:complete